MTGFGWGAMAGAGIQAAASHINNWIQTSAANNINSDNRQFQQDMYIDQREQWRTQLQQRVKDAELAGVHPVFAMGYQGGFSPSLPAGSSAMPDTRAPQIGELIAEAIGGREGARLDQEMRESDSRIKLNERRADYVSEQINASREARLGQNSNTSQDGSAVLLPGVAVPKVSQRPTRVEPNVNAPLFSVLQARDGTKFRVLSETAQADELNQILIAAQGSWEGAKRLAQAAGLSFVWNAGRQAYTLVRRATRPSSQGSIHRKGRRSLRELRARPVPLP